MNNLEITSTKLQKWLDKNRPVFILDVRSSDERNGWYIPESNHVDYISRTRELAEKSGAEHVLIDKADTDFSYETVKDGDVLAFGDSQVKILHTPGHTWESTSFLVDGKALLTGANRCAVS